MSLGIAYKGPEGIVLAADSRVTLSAVLATGQVVASSFDNATKLLSVQGQEYVGIVTYGAGAIGQKAPRTAHGFIPEFEARLSGKHKGRATVKEIATELGAFYSEQWRLGDMPTEVGPAIDPMVFLVAGFDEGEAYGRLYEVSVPNAPEPQEKQGGPDDLWGLTFGGQGELVARLLGGLDTRAAGIAQNALALDDAQLQTLIGRWRGELGLTIPYQFLPLQDCVNLATFLVYMTSMVQGWTVGVVRGVGGDVDVATITRTDGFKAVKQKTIEPWE